MNGFHRNWSHIKRQQLEGLLWEHFTVISFSLGWQGFSNFNRAKTASWIV